MQGNPFALKLYGVPLYLHEILRDRLQHHLRIRSNQFKSGSKNLLFACAIGPTQSYMIQLKQNRSHIIISILYICRLQTLYATQPVPGAFEPMAKRGFQTAGLRRIGEKRTQKQHLKGRPTGMLYCGVRWNACAGFYFWKGSESWVKIFLSWQCSVGLDMQEPRLILLNQDHLIKNHAIPCMSHACLFAFVKPRPPKDLGSTVAVFWGSASTSVGMPAHVPCMDDLIRKLITFGLPKVT